jgi:hypothetical protein
MSRIRAALSWIRSTFVWLLANPASLGVVTVALICGSVAGAPVSDKAYDYMWRDAQFCDDCHVHDYANQAWAKSVHGKLTTCHDCHRVPIRHYPKNLYVTVFQRPEVPEDIPKPEVGVVICEQCHSSKGAEEPLTGPMPEEIRSKVVHIDKSPLHRLHLDAESARPSNYQGGEDATEPEAPHAAGHEKPAGEGPIACLSCHGGENLTAHQFPAKSAVCEECHKGIQPHDESGGGLDCLDCHGPGFRGVQEAQDAK